MAAPRRKVVTYGRRANKGHSLFGQLDQDEEPIHRLKSPSIRDSDSATTTTSDHDDATMFDIPSSDDESRSTQSARKRRRLTPAPSNKPAPLQFTKTTKPASVAPLETNRSHPISGANRPTKKIGEKISTSRQASKGVHKRTYGRKAVPTPRNVLRSPSISPASRSSRSPSPRPLTPSKPMAAIDEMLVFNPPSTTSIPTPDGTPQQQTRLQNVLNDSDFVDTPSKLGLSKLQLKSATPSSDGKSSDGETSESLPNTNPKRQNTFAAPRRRLIDALGPSHLDSSPAPGTDDDEEEQLFKENRPSKEALSQSSAPSRAIGTSSSQPLSTGGPKLTYAKQRSYLSESMIDEIPPVTPFGNSQPSQTSSLSLMDNFDMDLDDEGGASGIRSIHELKKAGQAARFQGSLDAIFEDMDSSSKGRKILGYVQLGTKLCESRFRTQFINHAMDQRLIKFLGTTDNVLELSLQCTASALFLHDGQASLRSILSASVIIPYLLTLLQEQRTVEAVAADRKQNLSKATRRDLTGFFNEIVKSDLWQEGQQPTKLTPQLLALRLLDIILRRSREKNDLSVQLPLPILEVLVELLLHTAGPTELDANSMSRLQLIVSILESSTLKASSVDEIHFNVLAKLSNLGPVLEVLSSPAFTGSRQTQHLVLRLILNITNNSQPFCDAFAQPALLTAILKIVITEATKLNPSEGTDNGSSESTLLSLGLGISLAETSQKARELMTTLQYPSNDEFNLSTSCLERLLRLFLSLYESENSDISDAGRPDPTVVGEGQNLVAFGYLSVLLSVLCVEPIALKTTIARLPGRDIGILRSSLRDFIAHFRTMNDQMSGGEYAEFIARWEGVLRKLEKAAAAATATSI